MAWFKVDDTFPLHAKVLAAGNAAVGLWTRAGAWSMQQLTDGFVPDHVARLLGTPSEAKCLVRAGLWLRVDGGYQYHQWSEVQRTKEQVEADRHAAAERQRHARERAKSRSESRRDSRDGHAGSHGPPVSHPPDQTRPDQTSSTEADASVPPPAKERKKPSVRMPQDWKPTEQHWERRHDGIDVQREAAAFRAHAETHDRRCVNWNAAFTQWLIKARPAPQSPQAQPHVGRAAQWLDLARDLHDEQLAAEQQGPRQIGGGR